MEKGGIAQLVEYCAEWKRCWGSGQSLPTANAQSVPRQTPTLSHGKCPLWLPRTFSCSRNSHCWLPTTMRRDIGVNKVNLKKALYTSIAAMLPLPIKPCSWSDISQTSAYFSFLHTRALIMLDRDLLNTNIVFLLQTCHENLILCMKRVFKKAKLHYICNLKFQY